MEYLIGDPALLPRFWEKVHLDPERGCWLWTAGRDGGGYGLIWAGSGMKKAHRFSYTQLCGPIPNGLVLDHLCRVRHCVNPSHLDPVTQAENSQRGDTGKHNSSKTHCVNGHMYSADNTRYTRKGRDCRACAREYGRRKRRNTGTKIWNI